MRLSAATFALGLVFFCCFPSARAQAAAAPDAPCAAGLSGSAGKEGILSDPEGVDFHPYIQRIFRIVQSGWKPLMPREVDPPVRKSGEVVICFRIGTDGRLPEGGMVLEGRSGDEALDRAAWGAIQTAVFPPLPAGFKGPYIEVRFRFLYNAGTSASAAHKGPRTHPLPGPAGITVGYDSRL